MMYFLKFSMFLIDLEEKKTSRRDGLYQSSAVDTDRFQAVGSYPDCSDWHINRTLGNNRASGTASV
jgi:hypothetical protein